MENSNMSHRLNIRAIRRYILVNGNIIILMLINLNERKNAVKSKQEMKAYTVLERTIFNLV